MLTKLNGRSHKVITGVAIAHGGQIIKAECEETEVVFRNCSKQELEKYVNSRDPMDKAGAYGIQTGGARLIKEIRGCYYNVVGLPVARMLEMLVDMKVEV
jgi:septum formation protein